MRLKAEAKDQAILKAEEEAQFNEELMVKVEKEKKARLKAEDETWLYDELRLKAEAGGLCGVGYSVGCLWLLVPWCWQPLAVGIYCIFILPHL